MDTLLEGYSSSMNEFKFDHSSISVCSRHSLVNGFKFDNHFSEPPFLPTSPQPSDSDPSSSLSSEGDSREENDFSNAILKYISEMLMEEDLEGKTCMLQDCMALQAAERSFYDVIGAKYPPVPNKPPSFVDQRVNSPDECFTQNSSNYSSNGYTTDNNLVESNWVGDLGLFESSHHNALKSASQCNSESSCTPGSFCDTVDGLWEATKILPLASCGIVDLEPNKRTLEIVRKAAEDRSYNSPNGSSGSRKKREDGDYLEEGRSNKHSAVYIEVPEQLEMFDKVLLCNPGKNESTVDESIQSGASRKLQQNGQSKGSNGRTTRAKKQGNNKREVVDFSTLLTQCAQAVAGNDQRTTDELLKQIRQHSSPFGDGSQRLAHYFANGLEARLAGTRTELYSILATRTPAADVLKAYHLYVSSCPFQKMSNIFANKTIGKLAQKATRLHIIDFGISYGFQWPCLIQGLSARPGGPPKLRITGIELPQPGFRPAERVEETGHRLANYCKRFNVPFEYHAIAQKWETIKLEDLKTDRDEVLVVNSLYRLRNLFDETVVVNSPRDAVLKLIKRINPDIFIHGVVNGTYNSPFFVTRFRETLFHFSALFDMFEATVPRENEERMLYEKEMFGRNVMNIIACEGTERVDRPETYKQWRARNMNAGFRQLPLDKNIMELVRSKVKLEYNKDFVVDEDSQWMLQGWKGRIIHALSCWKPAS